MFHKLIQSNRYIYEQLNSKDMKNQKHKIVAMRLSEKDNNFIEAQAEKERLTKSSWMRRQIFLNT